MRHLDARSLEGLARRDAALVAYYREHLAAPCEECERFLSEHEGPWLLDGEVDAVLLSLAAHGEAALDEVGFARVRRALLRRGEARSRWSAVAGIAAGLLVVLAVDLLARPPDEGLKGTAPIGIELAASALEPSGRLARLDPGATVSEGDTVLLRYHATEKGAAVLLAQRDGAAPEVLATFEVLPGIHDVRGPGGLWGYSTSGVRGVVRLWLVARAGSEAPDPAVAVEVVRGAREAPLLGRAGVELRIED